MNLNIEFNKGLEGISFGCTPEVIRSIMGNPDEAENLENAVEGTMESIVWYYPDSGLNYFFDATNGEPVLCTIESENIETTLFETLVFNLSRSEITLLMKKYGFTDLEEDDEIWGEHRVTFDGAQADFYFVNDELTLVSWSSY